MAVPIIIITVSLIGIFFLSYALLLRRRHAMLRRSISQNVWNRIRQTNKDIKIGGYRLKDIPQYFERSSRVVTENIEHICDWLLGCEYVTDQKQFEQPDHWQHPVDFEKTRKGDCEDFALWAWRKLVELGYQAELVMGMWFATGQGGGHAWIVFYDQGERFVLETVEKDRESMIRRLDHPDLFYIPFVSVDHDFNHHVYEGMLHWYKHKR